MSVAAIKQWERGERKPGGAALKLLNLVEEKGLEGGALDRPRIDLVLEFKTAKGADDLVAVAQEALQQVKNKQYEVELKQAGIQSVLELGLAFQGKDVEVVSEVIAKFSGTPLFIVPIFCRIAGL